MSGHRWMETFDRSHSVWGQTPFEQLAFPRSHDAGAYNIRWHSRLANKAVIVTQTKTIREQLEQGVRIFDIRPVKVPGHDWACGHGTEVTWALGWQGGIGVSIQQLVDEVNGFLKDKQEVVLLEINGTILLDGHKKKYPTSQEWRDLLTIFGKLKNLFRKDEAAHGETFFKQYCFNDFKGKPAVLAVVDGMDDRRYLYDNGFWPSKHPSQEHNNNLNPDCGLLVRPQGGLESVFAFINRGGSKSVESLARERQLEMFPWLAQRSFFPWSGSELCCSISTDIIEDLDLLTVSLAINHQRINVLQGRSELLIYCNAEQVQQADILASVQNAIDEGRWYDDTADFLGAGHGPKVHGAVVVIYSQKGVIKGRYAKLGQRLHFEHDIMRVTYGDQEVEMSQEVYYNLLEFNWKHSQFLVNTATLGLKPGNASSNKCCKVEYRNWNGTITRTVSAYDGRYLDF